MGRPHGRSASSKGKHVQKRCPLQAAPSLTNTASLFMLPEWPPSRHVVIGYVGKYKNLSELIWLKSSLGYTCILGYSEAFHPIAMFSTSGGSSSAPTVPLSSTSARGKREQKNRRDMAAKVQRAMRAKVYGSIPKFTIDTFKVNGLLIEARIEEEYEKCNSNHLPQKVWDQILKEYGANTSVLKGLNIEDKKNCKVSDALLEVIDIAVTKNNKIRDSERLVLYLKYEGAVSEKDHRVYAIRSNSWCLRTL